MEELGVQLLARREGARKAANVARHQDWRTLCNSLVLCLFANVSPQDVSELLAAATGLEYGLDDLLAVGERSWNLKRIINHNLGLSSSNDQLPRSLLQPLADGGAAGYVPPLDEMLQGYYEARGWDPATGRPRPEQLRRLGLEWSIPQMWSQLSETSAARGRRGG
jgi:aldehyde:ferredoxin oxidoreductase